MPKSGRKRADVLLLERGLAESREQAQTLIMEGLVFTPAGRVLKPSSILADTAELEVRGRLPYVSRGGLKLAHALDVFGLDVTGAVALDVGASTGGFTDCLLQRGASRVYAIDVGHGQLHQKLRQDPRVVVMEKVNARYPVDLPQPVDLITIDVSFITLTLIIPAVAVHLQEGQPIIALVKPQFEARREEAGRGGVIKDPEVHARVLGRMTLWALDQGWLVRGITPSPVLGDAGNREFLLLLEKPRNLINAPEIAPPSDEDDESDSDGGRP
jgi:23S rRNA (cytidine1920-2'-O)/16S rRNA (cytidine1409-2'-O)-methyltransferase